MKMTQIILKIIVTALFGYGIFYVWSKEIDFKAIVQEPFNKMFQLKSKVEFPVLKANMINLSMKYKEGLTIDGITWRKDYQEIKFNFIYHKGKVELEDFKIDIQIPAGIVYYKIEQSSGFDNINSFINQDNMGISNGQVIDRLVKYYPNHLFVNALRIFPNASLTVKMIIKPALEHNNGFVKYNFNFINEKLHTITNDWVYPMPYILNNNLVHFNVSDEFVIGKYDYNIANIMEKPLVFSKDGNIKQ